MNPERAIITLAAFLVPARQRAEWRREWIAELHYARPLLRARGRGDVIRFALGAWKDAAWLGSSAFRYPDAQSPAVCLASITGLIALVVLVSGFLTNTRDVVLPLPYANAERIVTLSRGGFALAARSLVPTEWVDRWQRESRTIESFAAYTWHEENGLGLVATVSDRFFITVGVRAASGRLFRPGDAANCGRCVVLSYDLSRRAPRMIQIAGQEYRVIGVLEPRFWFLSRRVDVWSVMPAGAMPGHAGVVARLADGASVGDVRIELESIVRDAGLSNWDSFVDLSVIQTRVRSVFGSFALALCLAIVIVGIGLRLHPSTHEWRSAIIGGRWVFFVAKTAMLLATVLISGLEFTRATNITMMGGTDLLTEPLSTWLFLMGCAGSLTWSIYDQRRRCRVCLRRLGLAAHVGCPGCLLLNWAGTELVCIDGHGILHIPEMTSSWTEPERWIALDHSWQELFGGG